LAPPITFYSTRAGSAHWRHYRPHRTGSSNAHRNPRRSLHRRGSCRLNLCCRFRDDLGERQNVRRPVHRVACFCLPGRRPGADVVGCMTAYRERPGLPRGLRSGADRARDRPERCMGFVNGGICTASPRSTSLTRRLRKTQAMLLVRRRAASALRCSTPSRPARN